MENNPLKDVTGDGAGAGNGTALATIASFLEKWGVAIFAKEKGKLISVSKAEIDERGRGKSAMPDTVVNYLTKSELRDLVEFLSGLK